MSAKLTISKAFITSGMENEKTIKFQSISFKQGKQTSYIQIHIDEATRKELAPYLIKGQQVSITGNFTATSSKYKGVYQKNPIIWVEEIKVFFTPEVIAERARKLEAGEKISEEPKDTMTKVETPKKLVAKTIVEAPSQVVIEEQQENTQQEEKTKVELPQGEFEVVEGVSAKVEPTPIQQEVVEPPEPQPINNDAEMTEEEIIALMGG